LAVMSSDGEVLVADKDPSAREKEEGIIIEYD
jgi:hypothetical protein